MGSVPAEEQSIEGQAMAEGNGAVLAAEAGGAALGDATSMADLLRDARAAHERGDLNAAERGYLELLALDAAHAEASHLLGAVRFQEGKLPEAEALMRRAIERAPSPLTLANHAAVLAMLERREEALAQVDEALRLNPIHVRALLQRAGLLIELARYEAALDACDRLLVVAPASIDGLCRRSAVLRALRRFPEALVSCDRASSVDGRSFDALKERGHVLRELGRHEDALDSYGRALVIVPNSADVLLARGMTFAELERYDSALESLNEAIAAWPRFIDALYNSAVVLERMKRYEEAIKRCDRVIAIDPRHAKAFANRGNALRSLGRNKAAAESYSDALRLEPGNLEVLCNQAGALRHLDRGEDALKACEQALALGDDYTPARFAQGRALQWLHRYDEALASFERVCKAAPEDKYGHFQRGNVLKELRRHDEAKQAYGQAIAIDPDYVLAHCMLSFLCLSIADFEAGWKAYEWRWRDPQMSGRARNFPQPRWQGTEPLAGKTILLYAEQGLGDTLQFCRYVPLVKALGGRVVLEAQAELKTVLATLPGVDEFVVRGAPLPPFDLHCPLLSLPLAFKTELSTMPRDVPYLRADPALVEKWRTRLGPPRRPRVGLVWSGNPNHVNDRNRSIALSSLVPLLSPEFEWVSLQKVVREEERGVLTSSAVKHLGNKIADFSDTAALVEIMDCVLSVDTSVAHLAGALGKPLWVMLPYTPDFRWLLDRDDSPWYANVRLFRQSRPGDWRDVFGQIKAALPSVARAARA